MKHLVTALLALGMAGAALADGNDLCPGAAVAALPFNDTGTTIGANNTVGTIPAGCSNYTTVAGPDKIYRLVVATAGSLTVTATPTGATGYDPAIHLINDTTSACPAGTANTVTAGCVDGADAGLANAAETFTIAALPAGTYNLFVDSFYSAGTAGAPNRHNGPFTLAVTGTAVLGGGTSADTSITKTNGTTTTTAGTTTTYTIVATNLGPGVVTNGTVADTFPAACTTVTWTCAGGAGGSCTTANGTGNINNTVTLPVNGTATFTAQCAVSASATGTLANTATVTNPAGTSDPVAGNNSATDTDTITAAAAGILVINPTTVPFGNQNVGSTSAAQTVTLSNTGTATLNITTLTAAAAPFARTGAGTCVGATFAIAAGANCTLTYTFAPTATGPFNQTLTVTADSPGSGTIALSGTGVAAGVLNVSTTTVNFGNQTPGAATTSTVTVTNTGGAAVNITSLGAPTAPFSRSGGTCGTPPFVLAAGTSCTVIYRFAPTAAVQSTQIINITSDGGNFAITLTGTGLLAVQLNTLTNGTMVLLVLLFSGIALVQLRRRG